jgi:hypothetical protein
MSFRQYGGTNYASKNNIVKSHYTNASNLSVMTKVGQPASYINFESDISGNSFYGDFTVNGNLTITGAGNGIIFPNTSVQYTAVTSTDTYWLKYSTDQIYYTGTVLVGIGSITTFPDIPPDISFATNGNAFVNGKLKVGNISTGVAITNFSVEGSTGATTIRGPTYITGLTSGGAGVIEIADFSTPTATCRISAYAGDNYIESGINTTSGSSAPLYFTNMNGQNKWMTISNDGNVGIGITNPSYNLHVNGTFRVSAATSLGGTLNVEGNTILSVTGTSTAKTETLGDNTTRIATTAFVQSAVSNSSYWTLNTSNNNIYNNNLTTGNVGIGTSTPTCTLDVSGTARISSTLNVGNSTNLNIQIQPPNSIGYIVGSSTYGGIIQAGTSGTSGLWVQSGGGCLITNLAGDSTTRSDLSVANGTLYLTSGTLGQTSGSTSLISSYTTSISGNTTYINTFAYRYADGQNWDTTASTIIQSKIDATSKAMIEFNPQGYAGGIAITNFDRVGLKINSNGNSTFTGTVDAISYNAPSDYRIKENVELIGSKFTIDNLRPVTYINKLLNKQDMGFIAHELQEQYPFLVTGEKDGPVTQSVNYIGLIALLVKEIQELKQDIKILKMK